MMGDTKIEDSGEAKTFPRFAFPRTIKRVDLHSAVSDEDLEVLNLEIGDFQALDAIAQAQDHDRNVSNAQPQPAVDVDDIG